MVDVLLVRLLHEPGHSEIGLLLLLLLPPEGLVQVDVDEQQYWATPPLVMLQAPPLSLHLPQHLGRLLPCDCAAAERLQHVALHHAFRYPR